MFACSRLSVKGGGGGGQRGCWQKVGQGKEKTSSEGNLVELLSG